MVIVQRGYSGFGGYYGRSGDEWDTWCNQAADVWGDVTKDVAKAEEYRKSCVDCNQSFWCNKSQPPWVAIGVIGRIRGDGLPFGFSTDGNLTRQRLQEAGLLETAKGAYRQVKDKVAPASTPAVEPASAPIVQQIDVTRLRPGMRLIEDRPGGGGGGGGGGLSPKLLLGAAAIGGLLLWKGRFLR